MGKHSGFYKGEKKKKKQTKKSGVISPSITPSWQLPKVEIISKGKQKKG